MNWLAVIKGILVWIWSHKNVVAYAVLAGIIALLSCSRKNLQKAADIVAAEKTGLPDNIEFTTQLSGNKFTTTYRDSNGAIIHKEYYVPTEGGITVTKFVDLKKYNPNASPESKVVASTPTIPSLNPFNNFLGKLFQNKSDKNLKENGGVITDVKVFGFCFRPGLGVMYDGGFNSTRPITVGIDTKLLYVSRLSAGLGSTIDYPYIFISYHIDQFIPFIQVNNLELMGAYGKPYSDFSNSIFAIGGRTNF